LTVNVPGSGDYTCETPHLLCAFYWLELLDLLHGTVFHTISIKSVTLVFSSAASKLNFFVLHMALVLVSTPGRSVNSAIEMTILLLLNAWKTIYVVKYWLFFQAELFSAPTQKKEAAPNLRMVAYLEKEARQLILGFKVTNFSDIL